MILSYHAVPTEEEMFFISRPLRGSSFFAHFHAFNPYSTQLAPFKPVNLKVMLCMVFQLALPFKIAPLRP